MNFFRKKSLDGIKDGTVGDDLATSTAGGAVEPTDIGSEVVSDVAAPATTATSTTTPAGAGGAPAESIPGGIVGGGGIDLGSPMVDMNASMAKIKVEDEPEEDPEREQLENIVRQRDAAISALEKARQEKQQYLAQLEGELEKERLLQMKEALIHKIDSERIKRQTDNAEERLKSLEADMQDKAAIHEYANLIKGVAPKAGVDSQYVMKLQSQLQKAVKKMESTTEQMKELEDSSRDVIDQLTKEISTLVEERCRTELELRKQMDVLDGQKRDMQLEYEDRIKENLKTLQALKTKATKQTTIEELEVELEETESKLEELHRIQEKQQKTVEQLNKSLAAQENGM